MPPKRRPNAVAKKKRLKHKKCHRSKITKSCSSGSEAVLSSVTYCDSGRSDFNINKHDYTDLQQPTLESTGGTTTEESTHLNVSSSQETDASLLSLPPPTSDVSAELLQKVKQKLELFLNLRWIAIIRENSIHACMVSSQDNLSVQRNIVFNPNGSVQVFVHCQVMDEKRFVEKLDPPEPLDEDNVNTFVDRASKVVNNINAYSICSGFDDDKYRSAWPFCPFGKADQNPYQECRYSETFRSHNCDVLVISRKWRCTECNKLYGPLKRRAAAAEVENPHLNTKNEYLTESQKLKKLQDQSQKIHANSKQIQRLKEKMQALIEEQGVQIDTLLSGDLNGILSEHPLTPAQSIFIEQQIKASQKINMVGTRWHPTIIRLALSLHITSPAAYELLRDTGMVKLPSSRTLFDYSRVKPLVEGIDTYVLESLGETIKRFEDGQKYKKYHVLMADEMYISQNLIFQKGSGKMVGYTSLDKLDIETKIMEQYLENHVEEAPHKLASKVMVFMIKGVSSGIKEVVATFAVGNLSASQFYAWVWKVIGALERTGIPIIAFVTDGCSVNRAFIKMHKPVTITTSGVIFDTINKAAPHRKLYFLSDVPHLLKTIRNNVLNSRCDHKKSRRNLCYKRKKISWDFITKLYQARKSKVFKKSYKLNAMNVFPDSYARMKVKYAAEVLSRTVAQDLEDQGWFKASETVNFIRLVNDWFDCLNGAHSTMGNRKRNSNLDPYVSPNDPRFIQLKSFLEYLEDWEKDALSPQCNLDNSAATDVGMDDTVGAAAADDTLDPAEEGLGDEEEDNPASKRILSKPTREGIEITTLAFLDMVPFLLQEETKFINARIFTQDPLEQHFSKLRAGQGGSTNPNLGQVLNRNRSLHVIGQLGMKRRKGNSGESMSTVEVTSELLPKRKSEHTVKFFDLD